MFLTNIWQRKRWLTTAADRPRNFEETRAPKTVENVKKHITPKNDLKRREWRIVPKSLKEKGKNHNVACLASHFGRNRGEPSKIQIMASYRKKDQKMIVLKTGNTSYTLAPSRLHKSEKAPGINWKFWKHNPPSRQPVIPKGTQKRMHRNCLKNST